jgi:hypothetical protein
VLQKDFAIMSVAFRGRLTTSMTLTPFPGAPYPDFVIALVIDPDICNFHIGYVELYGNMVEYYDRLLHGGGLYPVVFTIL